MPYEYMDGKQSSSAYDHLPHLSEMTAAALQLLANDGPGFFLMVEGGRIDHAGHSKGLDNHEDRTMSNIGETIEFARAVQVVIDWAAKQDDTLVIVTADHECGGLLVVESNGPGNMPTVTWAGTDHTGIPVPVYASGPGAEQFRGSLDNTDLFPRMRQIIEQRIAEPAVAVE
jgi:alkaline phosphatase